MYIKKIKKNYSNTGRTYFVFQLFEDVENEKKRKPKMILTLGNKLNIAEAEHQDLADCIESKARNKGTLKTFSKEIETLAQEFTQQLKNRENARNKRPLQSNKKSFRGKITSSNDTSSEKRDQKPFSKFNPRIKASFNKAEYSSKDSVKKENSLSRFKSKRSFLKPHRDVNSSLYEREQSNQDSFERTSSAFKPKRSFSKSEDKSDNKKQNSFERTSSAFKPKRSFSISKKRAPSKTNRPWELAVKKQGK